MSMSTTGTEAGRPSAPGAAGGRSDNRLLWIAGAFFAVLLAGWAVFFVVAWRHPVATVPLAAPGGSTR
jgi:hypothetical protein